MAGTWRLPSVHDLESLIIGTSLIIERDHLIDGRVRFGSESDLLRDRLEGPLPCVKLTLPAGKRTSPHEGLFSGQQRKSEGTPVNSRS